MKKLITVLQILIFYSHNSLASENIHFGILNYDDKLKNYGIPFLKEDIKSNKKNDEYAIFERQEEANDYKKSAEKEISHFNIKQEYPAITADGKNTKILLTSKNNPEGEQYESLFESKNKKSQKLPILFWTSKTQNPLILKTENKKLTDSQKIYFQNKIKKVFQEKNLDLRDKKKLEKILDPVVQSPINSDLVTIFFPLIITYEDTPEYKDNRASFFIIYDLKKDKIILESFGHPEWSPEAENMQAIEPIFFFQLNNITYLFCKYDGPWEDSGYALMRLDTGKVDYKSY